MVEMRSERKRLDINVHWDKASAKAKSAGAHVALCKDGP
jgi:hypothetical protein